MASPASLTYQGRILKSDGTPLEYSSVSFAFQITDPTGQCVIYQEQINGINMSNSAGVFDVPIGNGTIQYPVGGATSVLDVFNNSSVFACGSCSLVNGNYACTNGSSNYTATIGDVRKLRVSFYDGSGWKLITPDNIVRSVPFAGYALAAQKLGTNVASDFLLKAGLPTCTAGTFLSYNGTALTCVPVAGASGGTVTNVTSANSYLTVINNTSTPTLTVNVGTAAGTLAAGDDSRLSDARTPTGAAGGVLSGSYPSPGLADSSVTTTKISDGAVSTSKLFTSPGINRLVATDSTSGATLAPLTCTSGQLLTWSATTGWQCSNQSSLAVGSATTATTATTSTNFTGSLAGDVSGTQGATSVDRIKGVPLDFSVAPTNGQVLKFNGTNWVPSTASSYSGVLPIANGGTNSSTALNNNRIMVSNGNAIIEASALTNGQLLIGSTGAAPVAASLTAGSGITITPAAGSITIGTIGLQASSLADGKIWVGQTGTPTAVTPSGDATMTNAGVLKVTGIQGISVSATSPSAAGQGLRYDGTINYAPTFLGLADIKSGITPFPGAFTNAGCTASQSLYWQSSTDTFQCQSVAIGDSQITYASKTANTFLAAPTGAAGAPTFRGIASADLPTTGANGAYVNGGNSFGAAATLGTNDAFTFGIKTNNATRMTFDTAGKVGIGISVPAYNLDLSANNGLTADAWKDVARFGEYSTGHGLAMGYIVNSGGTDLSGAYISTIGTGVNQYLGTSSHGQAISIQDSTGNVGIGTTNPTYRLDINGTGTDDGIVVRLPTNTVNNAFVSKGGANDVHNLYHGTIDEAIYAQSSNGIVKNMIRANGNSYLTGGALGIGTTNPGAQLDVNGTMQSTGAGGLIQIYNDSATVSRINANTGSELDLGVGGTKYLTILPSGNVGIGTTIPGAKLEVDNGNNITNISMSNTIGVQSRTTDSTGYTEFNLKNDINTTLRALTIGYTGSSYPGSYFTGGLVGEKGAIGTTGAYPLVFGTNNTQRMIIDATGNVGIGIASPSERLNVAGNIKAASANGSNILQLYNNGNGNAWNLRLQGDGTTPNNLYFDETSAGNMFFLRSNGNAWLAGSLTQASDERLKYSIHTIPDALNKVSRLRGATYYWRDLKRGKDQQIGLIAQEVEKVFPQVVQVTDKGWKAIAYQNLVAPIVNAIREIHDWLLRTDVRISNLETENAAKDKRIQALEERLEKLEKSTQTH